MDKRDEILQAHTPTVMLPRFGDLEPLLTNGHRFLVAENGLHIEVRRPWLHAIWPMTTDDVQLPYGAAPVGIHCAFEWHHLTQLIEQFTREARRRLPNECGAWILWQQMADGKGQLFLVDLEATDASPTSLDVKRPELAENVHLVCDVHSHGEGGAGFSGTDDTDDAGEVKYAAVVGKVHSADIDVAMRLCLPAGVFIDAGEWVDH